ncbi:MAG: hypothetical protein ACXACU_12775, partial [Candidatus Hodarchaeales archaeon]
EEWFFQIRVHDGTNYSSWINSSSIIVINSIPVVIDSTFNKTSDVTTNDNLSIVYSYYDIDNEENPAIDQEDTNLRIILLVQKWCI